ncbi:DnaD domain-containing protein [Brevibacillus invocatus]|uniref:DnaD domain-containing protein n=1 Tax=Brevibacillus invocatus TaxID=173959 RepID=UPI00203CEE72|nr:DnaD domain protein [Brevibacillus invocatus]MCM3079611.1 DnaD domain protein [Brevibacillus invocatus]MCM3429809.1 DnaD domain protein [Brevibacillus invocatus]
MHNKIVNNFLLDEAPLVILPSLAVQIGLNEAIVIQQLHYWLQKSTNIRDRQKWVYNTYKEWQEQFPFWSEITVRRVLTGLENKGIIVTGNYNEMKADKTKWYTLDYEKLRGVISPCDQNDQSMRSNRSDGCDQNDQSNTRYYTDITTDREVGGEEKPQGVISPPKADPYKFYTENITTVIPPIIIQDMDQWIAKNHFDEPEEIIVEALKETILNGTKSWKYTTKILIGWADQGLRTLHQVQAAIAEHERNKTSGFSNGRRSGSGRTQQANRTAAEQAQVDKLRGVQAVETDPNYDPNQDLELQQLMSQLQSKGDGEP